MTNYTDRKDWLPTWEYTKPIAKTKDFALYQPTKYYRVVKLGPATFEIQSRTELAKNWDRLTYVTELGEAMKYVEGIE